MKRPFFLLFFLFTYLYAGKLPELSPQDVVETLHSMMESHVSCKEFSPQLIKRALEHYLEELDPSKLYLLESEVAPWLNPTDAILADIQKKLSCGDFFHFEQIHQLMVTAIARRQAIEKKCEDLSLVRETSIAEFKDLSWAKDEEELSDRLLKIKTLQINAAKKLECDSQEKALKRIAKHRATREEEICRNNEQEQACLIRANILKAFASSFDTHTSYFTPQEAAQFMIQVQQRLFGIGAQLRDDLNGFTVVKIIEGGPASRGTGLKANDRIIAIDDEPVVGLDITEAVELIRGEEGSIVHLTVLRPTEAGEETLKIKIVRGEVVIQEARIESKVIPYGDGAIAHITLHAFYQDPQHCSSADLYDEIRKIQKNYVIKGIILDLRDNAGGVLPQAVAVTGLFITKGIVCSIKDNNGTIEHLRDIEGKTAYDGPLIILTSKASASASEIVAQTLQDYGRAIIVGDEHTYGKGTFQTFSLDPSNQSKINPKGEFKVTRGKYYTVSGKSPQLNGVVPDIIVPGFLATAEIGERHAKHPLENDSIKENFNDDLSDIPTLQRDQISWLYRYNLQPKIKTYSRYLPTLQKNSSQRIQNDPYYQFFLTEMKDENIEGATIDQFIKSDPQLCEAINIMKDLILLLK
jgi:carboxyl-terminal processing protease